VKQRNCTVAVARTPVGRHRFVAAAVVPAEGESTVRIGASEAYCIAADDCKVAHTFGHRTADDDARHTLNSVEEMASACLHLCHSASGNICRLSQADRYKRSLCDRPLFLLECKCHPISRARWRKSLAGGS